MDFSRVQLADEDQAFLNEARAFLTEHVTEDVIRRDRETGDNFDEGVHLALGAAGYLHGEWHTEDEGGFSRVQRRLWELEKRRHHVPWVTMGTTSMVAKTVAAFASPELRDEVLPKVFSGHARLCLGYTEPEGGSDIATCKTRAVRDGDHRDLHVRSRRQRQMCIRDSFSRVQRRLWELEKRRHHVPWVTMGTTSMVAKTVAAFCLLYTSPSPRDRS